MARATDVCSAARRERSSLLSSQLCEFRERTPARPSFSARPSSPAARQDSIIQQSAVCREPHISARPSSPAARQTSLMQQSAVCREPCITRCVTEKRASFRSREIYFFRLLFIFLRRAGRTDTRRRTSNAQEREKETAEEQEQPERANTTATT